VTQHFLQVMSSEEFDLCVRRSKNTGIMFSTYETVGGKGVCVVQWHVPDECLPDSHFCRDNEYEIGAAK